ncbi:ActS/PrrB/RegB family redox-sensitive histidine kinase [Paracoccus sp. SCSIO 75233]|uniref:ActS/PrrB/RegB family redox-sensitive histidine kinase n=1 Tax=Paracoccus sp. SCSIO 75233 TaxID=3017782 RepID=UPI0022F0BD91|nr:ActS/PrrB/RegB family redox-sensitive histidine kinase [Paracoccus sp. SCSIO 75233]WBU52896.1 ActS/PrrB/RegB family redox-sensitive histidine kinase [Paracoccus sp. SCSIO 75233]
MSHSEEFTLAFNTNQGRPAEPIRRRTLILLRWVALGGQLAAIIVASLAGIEFARGPALLVVGMGAAVNLWMIMSPLRVTQSGATWQLVFDLAQISLLIGLTGGLSNPFALLVLAPVTIAATALRRRQTILVGIATVVMISIAAWLALPLKHETLDLSMPPILQFGHFIAILIGVVFFAFYARRVSEEFAMTANALFATRTALAREQKLQHLGGIVAATAHEMGTPLATIKLIASELKDELEEALPDRIDLTEDAATLALSVDRCREIMRSMGQAGKDDLTLHAAPLRTVLEEAAAPHAERGTRITITLSDESGAPTIHRDPGVVHGLRNIIQNAVDFAESKVIITAEWSERQIDLTISDDGPGFPTYMLGRLGDPFPVGRRNDGRAGYEGMGLGLFIARTLLESSGAQVTYANGPVGARVSISWPISRINASDRIALSENPQIN